MLIANHRDFWSGILFVTIGLSSAVAAWILYPLGDASNPGPGYFPLGLGALLALLGSVVVVSSLSGKRDKTGTIGRIAWRPLIVVFGAVLMFALLLPRLGLFVALPSLVIASSYATAEFRWREVLPNAVTLTALCFGIFVWALNVTLPH